MNNHDKARKAIEDIYKYASRTSVAYQSGDGTNAPAMIFADADYEAGDGNLGLHENSKSANGPTIIYVRADALELAYAQIAALHKNASALLERYKNTCGNDGQMFYDALDKTLLDTKQAAFAFESRIRADERERVIVKIKSIGLQVFADRFKNKENPELILWDYLRDIAFTLHCDNGEGDE